jgi:hypothetical protein
MAGLLIVPGLWPVFDANGDPVSGATIRFYQAGTTNPRAVFSDATLSTSLGTQLTTNAAGEPTTLAGVVARLWWVGDGSVLDVQVTAGASTRTWSGVVVSSDGSIVQRPVNVLAFGAVGDGVTNNATAINAAITYVNGLGGGIVYFPSGTFLITATINMRANVRLLGEHQTSAIIKQGNGANLNPMIEFTPGGINADNSAIEKLGIDCNSGANTLGTGIFSVHIRTASNVEIVRNRFLNTPGWFIASNALRPIVRENTFDGTYMKAAFFYNAAPAPTDAYALFENNLCINMGAGAVLFEGSNYGIARNNRIIGTLVGGRGARITVNTSGNTITHVSGPNFANVRAGMFACLNNGAEFRITNKVSNTQLTVDPVLPTLSGTQAGFGPGDLMGNLYSSFCQVVENYCANNATYAMGGVIGGTAYQCSNNTWERNTIINCGKDAINITYDGGTGFLDMNSVIGNKIVNPGSCGGIAPFDRVGIKVFVGAANKVTNTFIDDNTVDSAAGDGQTEYWLALDTGATTVSTFVGKNLASGMVNSGIQNDIISIVPSAGWGSTATVDQILSHGSAVQFRVNCAGSGIGLNPSLTINKRVGSTNNPPIIFGKLMTSTAATYRVFGETNSTRGAWALFIDGTPVTAQSYVFGATEN